MNIRMPGERMRSRLRLFNQQFLSVLFWSILAAAFIGPGTVTTAATAGSSYGFELLWALTFSTIACMVLQEASARLTITTGHDLGSFIAMNYHEGIKGFLLVGLVILAILFGCAAYEVGNILGALEGLRLITDHPGKGWVLLIFLLSGLLLWSGKTQWITRILGGLVALMGLSFLLAAVKLKPDPGAILKGMFVPGIPKGSLPVVLGLIGTTVVPYNLFLGSGLAHGKNIRDTRFGIIVAVGLGGLISMGVLVTGTSVEPPLSFASLGAALGSKIGRLGSFLLAIGLFSAGFTSAVTAPLAAALTAKGLFGHWGGDEWDLRGWKFRVIWLVVLITGVLFALGDIKPIPAIILAQAFNGVLLPIVASILFVVINDRQRIPEEGWNGWKANVLFGLVVWIVTILGTRLSFQAVARLIGLTTAPILTLSILMGSLWTVFLIGYLLYKRQ